MMFRAKKSILNHAGEIQRDRFNQLADAFLRGSFTFLPNATADPTRRTSTGYSFADFLLGEVGSSTVSSGRAEAQLRANYLSAFVQDDWKITTRLTMNAGLRYEYQQPWYDRDTAAER